MKKVKIVLSFILCFILFVGAPSTAYAKTVSITNVDVLIYTGSVDGLPDVEANDVSIPHYFKNNYPQIKYQRYQLYSDTFQISEGDTIDVNIVLNYGKSCRYISWESSTFSVFTELDNGMALCDTDNDTAFYNSETGTIHFTTTVKNVVGDCYICWYGDYPALTSDSPSVTFSFGVTDFTIDVKSEQSVFFDKVSDFFQGLFDKLTAWFDSLFQWLRDIRDNASEGFSNIGNWFTELGNKIKSFFTELGNNIKEQFTNMINNLKSFFADVGQWFKDIGDKIGGFFEKLWNRIWWGNENGESEYQKPVINNKLNDILDTLNGYQLQLKNTIDTISSTADSVSTYISTGTQLVNGIINVAGVGFTALIVFAIVFVLARKVVGR